MSTGYLPFSVHDIEIICNETLFRPIWAYGVELNSRQKYISPALGNLRMRIGVNAEHGRSLSKVKIKAPKLNIGSIWVFDPFEKMWIKVSNVNPDYAEGLTLYEHKLIKKFAHDLYHESDDYKILIEAKELMRQHVVGLSNSKLLADRKRAAKIVGTTSRKHSKKTQKPDLVLTDHDELDLVDPTENYLPTERHETRPPPQDEYEIEPHNLFRSESA
ncbi:hypothetical protein [Undibacterium curvum]|uniref:Uncharacterized protein n=1 Tax=Undibacterium curvum TaxID=2762294 RepID=A0ABR7A6U3_9BURK|nr:hypothetical protein [Undibacterium curvum]MBC3932610.1 hypothetical protein [Undibacterium curvum]